ncbi:hypothetical protein V8C37DRAFT_111703 [Trichoderma ceciliae]
MHHNLTLSPVHLQYHISVSMSCHPTAEQFQKLTTKEIFSLLWQRSQLMTVSSTWSTFHFYSASQYPNIPISQYPIFIWVCFVLFFFSLWSFWPLAARDTLTYYVYLAESRDSKNPPSRWAFPLALLLGLFHCYDLQLCSVAVFVAFSELQQ